MHWTLSPGTGTIWSFVVAHPPLPGPFAEIAPISAILVALDDPTGIRIMGTLLDSDSTALAIGDPVEVVYRSVAGGPVLPHFRLAVS